MIVIIKSLPLISLLLALTSTFTQAAMFTVINKCPYTVWPAIAARGGVSGGRKLYSGKTGSLKVPAGTALGRIWARTNCSFDIRGRGHCETGDCEGLLQCQAYGSPPTTLAEFSLNQYKNLDFYDISVIGGFNVPMEFSPASNGCTLALRCDADACPDAYSCPEDDDKTHSCPGGTNYKVVFCP